jgi:hypothetical protein
MNNAQCEPLTGRCLCHSGHVGRYCERCLSLILFLLFSDDFVRFFSLACERGWYGPGCIHRCDCLNGATCDARTGICLCGMGVTGRLCDQGLYELMRKNLILLCDNKIRMSRRNIWKKLFGNVFM